MTIKVFFSEFYPPTTGVGGSAVSSASRKDLEDIVKNLDSISLSRLEEARAEYNTKINTAKERFEELLNLVDPEIGTPGRRILDLEIKTDSLLGRASTIESYIGDPTGSGTLFGRIAQLEVITSGDGLVTTEQFNQLKSVVSQSARTFIQGTPPTGAPNGIELSAGDLWINSSDNNKLHRYNGSSWVDATPVGSTLKTFAQPDAPTSEMASGDLWFDTNDNNRMYRYNGTSWLIVEDNRIGQLSNTVTTHTQQITDLNTGKASNSRVDGVESIAVLKNRVFHRPDAPTSPINGASIIVGDVWIDTDDNNKLYVWRGAAGWVLASDNRALAELEAARAGHLSLSAKLGNLETTFTDALNGKAGATKYDYLEAEIRTAAGGPGKALNERINSVDVNVNGSAAATRVGNLELSVGDVKTRLTVTENVAIDARGKAENTFGVVSDVNGYATSFQLANNGVSSSFKIRADKFEVASPGSTGARTEYSGNSWKVYDSNGVKRVEMGVF